jgi:archaemetzincin
MSPGLSQRFNTTVVIGDPIPLVKEWLDETREQYLAGPILDAIVDRHRDYSRTLGVIDADIFAPSLNFIFGQALVGGCCAIIGLARLRSEFYGQESRQDLFERRVLTEAVHEIGHTAGLDHCPDQLCVMNFSKTIRDTDRKGADFCSLCLAQIQ